MLIMIIKRFISHQFPEREVCRIRFNQGGAGNKPGHQKGHLVQEGSI